MSSIQIEITRQQVDEIVSKNLGRAISDQEWQSLQPALAQLVRGYLFLRLIHSGFNFRDYMESILKEEFVVFHWYFGFKFSELAKELGN